MIRNGEMFGLRNKLDCSLDRLRTFEPEEGYYLAFSGGKDSQTIYHLAEDAGVKFDAHYRLTTVDPPELVRFIKKEYPKVHIDRPEMTMWELIPDRRMPPTHSARYCCSVLKEQGGKGRVVVTGVRRAESAARSGRGMLTINQGKKAEVVLNNDNDESRMMYERCLNKGKCVLNPIVDWDVDEVWEYLGKRPHCSLYDEGFTRLGCIGCPLSGRKQMRKDFDRWPKYYDAYIRAFDKMLDERAKAGLPTPTWRNGQDVMDWWLKPKVKRPSERTKDPVISGQSVLEMG